MTHTEEPRKPLSQEHKVALSKSLKAHWAFIKGNGIERRNNGEPKKDYKNHKYNLKIKYGITPEQYDVLLKAQKGLCALCRNVNTFGKRLFVDHDHETKQIRGLLCNNCNLGLGMFKDNMTVLTRASGYLMAAKGNLMFNRGKNPWL